MEPVRGAAVHGEGGGAPHPGPHRLLLPDAPPPPLAAHPGIRECRGGPHVRRKWQCGVCDAAKQVQGHRFPNLSRTQYCKLPAITLANCSRTRGLTCRHDGHAHRKRGAAGHRQAQA